MKMRSNAIVCVIIFFAGSVITISSSPPEQKRSGNWNKNLNASPIANGMEADMRRNYTKKRFPRNIGMGGGADNSYNPVEKNAIQGNRSNDRVSSMGNVTTTTAYPMRDGSDSTSIVFNDELPKLKTGEKSDSTPSTLSNMISTLKPEVLLVEMTTSSTTFESTHSTIRPETFSSSTAACVGDACTGVRSYDSSTTQNATVPVNGSTVSPMGGENLPSGSETDGGWTRGDDENQNTTAVVNDIAHNESTTAQSTTQTGDDRLITLLDAKSTERKSSFTSRRPTGHYWNHTTVTNVSVTPLGMRDNDTTFSEEQSTQPSTSSSTVGEMSTYNESQQSTRRDWNIDSWTTPGIKETTEATVESATEDDVWDQPSKRSRRPHMRRPKKKKPEEFEEQDEEDTSLLVCAVVGGALFLLIIMCILCLFAFKSKKTGRPEQRNANITPAMDDGANEWAPDRIAAAQFNYKGPLNIQFKQPLVMEHELQHEKEASQHESQHVEFDDKLNEVYEMGSGIEVTVIDEKKTSSSKTKPKHPERNLRRPRQPSKDAPTTVREE